MNERLLTDEERTVARLGFRTQHDVAPTADDSGRCVCCECEEERENALLLAQDQKTLNLIRLGLHIATLVLCLAACSGEVSIAEGEGGAPPGIGEYCRTDANCERNGYAPGLVCDLENKACVEP